MKWQPGQRERTERLYLGLSRPYFGADLVVCRAARCRRARSMLSRRSSVCR
jgi:hypothetical protein